MVDAGIEDSIEKEQRRLGWSDEELLKEGRESGFLGDDQDLNDLTDEEGIAFLNHLEEFMSEDEFEDWEDEETPQPTPQDEDEDDQE